MRDSPSSSIGVAFLKSYAAICLEGCVIVLACVIFSAFASSPPAIADDTLAAATIVWNYVGELIFNMLVLVGAIKMSDRIIPGADGPWLIQRHRPSVLTVSSPFSRALRTR